MSQKRFRTAAGAFLAALIGLGGAGSSAGAQEEGGALSILETAAEKYRASTTLCADFRQELSIPLLGEKRSGHGRLCQKQPNLFMMRFT